MKALFIYIALGAVAINIASNMMSGTAKALQDRQEARQEQLCQVNKLYCSR